jgi:Tfp pilus assembly protein PilX
VLKPLVPTKSRQQGASIIMVMIALTALLLGSATLMRSTESATMIVANTTFKDAAVRAGELGINAGFTAIQALASEETNLAPWYYATTQPVDAAGMPSTVVWAGVPSTAMGNYQVQWVAERLCIAPLPVTDVFGQCQVSQTQQAGSSRGGYGIPIQNDPIKYYRITTRITGPKGTEQFVQSLVSR